MRDITLILITTPLLILLMYLPMIIGKEVFSIDLTLVGLIGVVVCECLIILGNRFHNEYKNKKVI